MKIIALGGFLNGSFGLPDIEKDLEGWEQNYEIIKPQNRLHNWSSKTDEYLLGLVPKEPYVAMGFSDGATAAARLADQDENCVGLIFISGLFQKVKEETGEKFGIFLTTKGEMRRIRRGTEKTFEQFKNKSIITVRMESKKPDNCWFPHCMGIKHHLETIDAWLEFFAEMRSQGTL